METNEQILSKYLRRKIASQNAEFSKLMYGFGTDQYGLLRANIYNTFARGESGTFDNTSSLYTMRDIKQHIIDNPKGQSPYDYFDLDTLIAFSTYLSTVLSHAKDFKNREKRSRYVLGDFSTAINYTAPRFFIDNSDSSDTGYYNLQTPVTALRDERGRLTYIRTPNKKAFESKYNYIECEEMLNDYLESKHNKDYDPRHYDFEFGDAKYVIDKYENYRTQEDYSICYISAHDIDNGSDLRGFFDMNFNPYYGDIYNVEGEYVYPECDSGVLVDGKDPDFGDNSEFIPTEDREDEDIYEMDWAFNNFDN